MNRQDHIDLANLFLSSGSITFVASYVFRILVVTKFPELIPPQYRNDFNLIADAVTSLSSGYVFFGLLHYRNFLTDDRTIIGKNETEENDCKTGKSFQ